MAPINEKVEDKYLQDAETGDMDDIELHKLTQKILWKLDTRYDNTLPFVSVTHRAQSPSSPSTSLPMQLP